MNKAFILDFDLHFGDGCQYPKRKRNGDHSESGLLIAVRILKECRNRLARTDADLIAVSLLRQS